MIKPTVGRVVWFYPEANSATSGFAAPIEGEPLAAIVAHVWNDRGVNLTVFDANGVPHACTSVPLLQEGDKTPEGCFATWMPYQIDQAKKAADARQLVAAADRTADEQRWRAHALDMALRTPNLLGYDDVLRAAAAYQAHIEGKGTAPDTAARDMAVAKEVVKSLCWVLEPYSPERFNEDYLLPVIARAN